MYLLFSVSPSLDLPIVMILAGTSLLPIDSLLKIQRLFVETGGAYSSTNMESSCAVCIWEKIKWQEKYILITFFIRHDQ